VPRGRPTEPETLARVEALVKAGDLGRNAIARECGVSGAVVSAVAADLGIVFDWAKTEAATAARLVQAAEIRENLANLFLLEAHRALQDLHAPAVTFQFESGHEVTVEEDGKTTTRYEPGAFREHVLPEPTFSDKRNLMTIAGIAISKAAEVSRPQPGQGAEEGVAVLTRLARAIDRMAEDGDLVDVDPTEVPDPSGA
jgi:hypothetical protein